MMTEFARLQDAAGLSNEQTARLIKKSERTVTRYRTCKNAAPFSVLFTLKNFRLAIKDKS